MSSFLPNPGVVVIKGKPGKGKSYVATWLIIELLKKGEKVFTNYPIEYYEPLTFTQKTYNFILKLLKKEPKYTQKFYEPFMWHRDYITSIPSSNISSVRDAHIFLDEGHKYFPVGYEKLSETEKAFFTEHRHNNNNIYLISQRVGNINNVIRESVINYYIEVNAKFSSWSKQDQYGRRPFSSCQIDVYTNEADIGHNKNDKSKKKKDLRESKKSLSFKKHIAQAYNTLWYRSVGNERQYTTWSDFRKDIDRYIPTKENKILVEKRIKNEQSE